MTVSVRDEARNVATGRPVAVLPGVYEVRESLGPVFHTPDCWVSLYLLVDPAGRRPPVAVDSGVPRSTETVLLPALRTLGIAPQELAVVVNTHSHHDHAGSNVQLREATGCQVWIHRLEGPALERGSFFGEEPCLPHTADRLLDDGERLDLAGRGYEVVHIPGHSPGSIGLLDRERGLFFSGDALQAQGTATQGIPGAQDREGYARTLLRVEGLEIEHLLAAHPYLPFTESYVRPRAEVRRYLAECRRFVEEMDGEILAAVRQGQDGDPPGVTSGDLAERICAGRGFPRVCLLTESILRGYLARLEHAGQVRRRGEGPGAAWWVD
ncbi:MAG TPA: MBL fold metallo-hydrolase [Chloroflexota bacterium]|nr:MBL fold metallo-hydrolase [Chloroflexota bacterium]